MTSNTQLRLKILASALALVVAAPVAIAQNSGTWYGDRHTDPVTAEGLVVSHSRALMEQRIVASSPAEKLFQLTDGSTVHVFADGKMAMESQFGRAVQMEPGHAMQTKDGKTIAMNGNEVARLDQELAKIRVGF